MLPPEEAALRLLERIEAQAADVLEFQPVSRYYAADGIDRIIEDLKPDFEEKAVHLIGSLTRRYEGIAREAGESIYTYVMRFRHLEAEMTANLLPKYPEYSRVLKLLDGSRLSDDTIARVLTATGNKYE